MTSSRLWRSRIDESHHSSPVQSSVTARILYANVIKDDDMLWRVIPFHCPDAGFLFIFLLHYRFREYIIHMYPSVRLLFDTFSTHLCITTPSRYHLLNLYGSRKDGWGVSWNFCSRLGLFHRHVPFNWMLYNVKWHSQHLVFRV